ncbi:hypothetical protein CLBEJ_41620 [Clostridium beijerinckii]|nr:hypothetical protein [Clostridium beijerinckii]NRU22193.1 hypothetical protein [Clostridium beijerinckii]OOM26811.1 hypothetical protein CLBEJ_41620 [Clostridium beijerinckii]OOM36036.1 hypothetical protein CLOBJ_42640 [Clostridium beijerinckii]
MASGILPLDVNGNTTILSRDVTVDAGEILKLDSMAEIDLVTAAALVTYSYTIEFELFRGATSLATVTINNSDTLTLLVARNLTEVPNLTWTDTPGAGTFTYTIVITITSTNITSADAVTRALNITIF